MRTLADIKRIVEGEPSDQTLGEKIRAFINREDPKHFRLCIKCGRWQSDLNDNCQYCGKQLNMMNHED